MQVDMSPEAVGQRLKTMDELWELSVELMRSRKVDGTAERVISLVDTFRRAAINKGDFSAAGRDRKLYEVMRDSYHRLMALGEDGLRELTGLLDDESIHVRTWIAAALLREGSNQARKVLEEIAKVKGVMGLDARVTLEEFYKGDLTSPFPENSGDDKE